jgi:hypothetical protein
MSDDMLEMRASLRALTRLRRIWFKELAKVGVEGESLRPLQIAKLFNRLGWGRASGLFTFLFQRHPATTIAP